MVEYVEFQENNPNEYNPSNKFKDCLKLKNLLIQQPNISMFVPAVFENEEWKILTEPTYSTNHSDDCYCDDCEKETKRCSELQKQYQTAIDNVIFEGFEYNTDCLWHWNGHERVVIHSKVLGFDIEIQTLEDLTKYNLTLTPKFAKELGLI